MIKGLTEYLQSISGFFALFFFFGNVFLFSVSCGGGSESGPGASTGGGAVPKAQLDPFILHVSSAPQSVQANELFSVEVDFIVNATGLLLSNGVGVEVSLAVESGPGNLVGTTTLIASQGDHIRFDNLHLDQAGSYQLRASSPQALASGFSGNIQVSASLELHFLNVPSTASVGKPFALTLQARDAFTGSPSPPPAGTQVSLQPAIGVSSGSIIAGGTANFDGKSSNVILSNIIYDAVETVQFQASASGFTDVLSPSISFSASALFQEGLRILHAPSSVIFGEPFALDVEAYDLGTGNAFIPSAGTRVNILPVAGASTGKISSGGSTVFNGFSSTLTLSGILYDTQENAQFELNTSGFQSAFTSVIPFEGIALRLSSSPLSLLVNESFSLSVDLVRDVSQLPYVPQSPLTLDLTLVAGSGHLQGVTQKLSAGSSVFFDGLHYDALGDMRIQVSTPSVGIMAITTPTIPVRVQLKVDSEFDLLYQPAQTINTMDFITQDGQGQPFALPSSTNLHYRLEESQSATLEQSGSIGFSGSSVALTLNPVQQSGSYRFEADLQSVFVEPLSFEIEVLSHVLNDSIGAFIALKSVRAGSTYQDSVVHGATLSGITHYALISGNLPLGLSFDRNSGELSGVPRVPGTYQFKVGGFAGGQVEPYRCVLTVFNRGETEIISGNNFEGLGTLTVQSATDSFAFTSSFDAQNYSTDLLIYHPDFSQLNEAAPVLVMHRGKGFDYDDYDEFLGHLASWGIICVSVKDHQSFENRTLAQNQDLILDYNHNFSKGMQSAGAFQEATIEYLTTRMNNPNDSLFGKADPHKIFAAGHSRGGGATHGTHLRSSQNNIRGAIYFMAFDLRNSSDTVSPTSPPIYAVPEELSRTPSLIISAEDDGDLVYPTADMLIDRATGPTTFVTVYGANHNRLGDSGIQDEGNASISRDVQQKRIGNFVIAFIKRWADLDVSLDGFLYGDEYAGSGQVGVSTWRNMAERTLVDDFQDGNQALNVLGGSNSFIGGQRDEENIYPIANLGYPGFLTLNLKHCLLSFNALSAKYAASFPALNVRAHKRVIVRMGQKGMQGYDFLTCSLNLKDEHGELAEKIIFDRNNQSDNYLPDYSGGPQVYDRFVEVSVLLDDLQVENPELELSKLVEFSLNFSFDLVPNDSLYIDNLRFE